MKEIQGAIEEIEDLLLDFKKKNDTPDVVELFQDKGINYHKLEIKKNFFRSNKT